MTRILDMDLTAEAALIAAGEGSPLQLEEAAPWHNRGAPLISAVK